VFSHTVDVPQLTGLRAVAASMVLFLHLSQFHGHYLESYLVVVDQGFLGVDIFFVLSGYIISHVYGSDFLRFSGSKYGIFLWRRVARLYPVHIATLLGLIAMVTARGLLDTNFWTVDQIPRHMLMLNAWTPEVSWNIPAWSISAEMLAYILFPIFVFALLRPDSLIVPIIVVAALVAWFQVSIGEQGIALSYHGWPAAARIGCEFALGTVMFRIGRDLPVSKYWDGLAAIFFVAIFLVPAVTLKVIAIACFVLAIAKSDGVVKSILSTRMAVYLGVISYSIFMVHFPIIKLILKTKEVLGIEATGAIENVLLVCLFALVVIGIASGLYHLVEAPGRRWLRKIEASFRGNATS
jgi:peptidoglycan/LPS O-acetylase OafA/YrhL